jgi:hypothetical protein
LFFVCLFAFFIGGVKGDNCQKMVIAGIAASLAGVMTVIDQLLSGLEAILPDGSLRLEETIPSLIQWVWYVFIDAGIAHFALADTFMALIPPRGIRGKMWNVPAPGAEALH